MGLNKRTILLATALAITVFSASASAQSQSGANADEQFSQARDLAFNGKREEARTICRAILDKNPNYHDARLLLGRLYSWDSQYETARKELETVVEAKPDYADARDALIDVELWSGNPKNALKYCEEGLQREPQNDRFLYKKARALSASGNAKAAIAAAENAVAVNPSNTEAQALLEKLKKENRLYELKIDYTGDYFNMDFDPWKFVSLSLSRRTPIGSVIGRVNYSNRFDVNGVQFEIDAYPKFKDGMYAYLNAGYSSSSIFPEFRFGSELYYNFPKGIEGSVGIRYLRFNSTDVTIYTGSFAKYYKSYYFSFRPYFTPSSVGTSFSANFKARRYFGDANYLEFSFGAGSSPDRTLTTLDLFRLNSYNTLIEGRKDLGKGVTGIVSFGFESSQLISRSDRRRYTFSLGMAKRF